MMIYTLLGICIIMAVWSLIDKRRMLQFPGLAAWLVGFLIVPQLLALNDAQERLPPDALDKVVFMVLLCLLMTYLGYYASKRPPHEFSWHFSKRRLLYGATFLAVVGQASLFMLQSVTADIPSGEMWAGAPIKYLFFAQAGRYAFSIGLVVYMLTRKKWALILALPNAIDAIQVFIFYGRRTSTAVFGLTVLCALWFSRRRAVPRWVMVLGVLLFSAFVLNVGQYRKPSSDKNLNSRVEVIREIKWEDTFTRDNFIGANAIDMENAAYIISAADSSGRLDYGASMWNWIVMAYVPRQVVGMEFKKSLLLGENVWDMVSEVSGYSAPYGSCATGIAEAFYSFWYFGALLFYVLGYIMRRLWEGSMRGGIIYQVVYFNFIAMAIGVYNGVIGNMLMPWPHMIFFLGPVFLYARAKPGEDTVLNKDILRPQFFEDKRHGGRSRAEKDGIR